MRWREEKRQEEGTEKRLRFEKELQLKSWMRSHCSSNMEMTRMISGLDSRPLMDRKSSVVRNPSASVSSSMNRS